MKCSCAASISQSSSPPSPSLSLGSQPIDIRRRCSSSSVPEACTTKSCDAVNWSLSSDKCRAMHPGLRLSAAPMFWTSALRLLRCCSSDIICTGALVDGDEGGVRNSSSSGLDGLNEQRVVTYRDGNGASQISHAVLDAGLRYEHNGQAPVALDQCAAARG